MSSNQQLRVLLVPFFATSHIGPFTDLAVRLSSLSAAVGVEATVAVTPANVPLVRSLLERHGHAGGRVQVVTYPFPAVGAGLPEGVENPGKAAPGEAWRLDAAAWSETLMRPAQEALIRAKSPDAIVTDVHFVWNAEIADELGVPCVQFATMGAFPAIALRHLSTLAAGAATETEAAVVPGFPAPEIRIPRTELPELLRGQQLSDDSMSESFAAAQARCFGLAVNSFPGLERRYAEMYLREGYVKRAYFIGPLSLTAVAGAGVVGGDPCLGWLDSRPDRSVVYLCFGSLAPVSDAQLRELALGLEASGVSFVWVVRLRTAAEKWNPPEGWEERVKGRGFLITSWAPQTAILGHPAVGAFVTHCGWNSVLEAVAAGMPVLTWPMVFEQFITERLLTEVLGIGERVWPDGAGVRSTRYGEHGVVPAGDVARALAAFMRPGGPAEAARMKVMDLAVKAREAMADGGSSHRDLRRLVDDLMEAKPAGGQ